MTAIEKIEEALRACGSVKSGGNWNCPGPVHAAGDRTPSLHVSHDARGVALKCHTGCDTPDVVNALGLTMNDLSEPRSNIRYPYRDETGMVLYHQIRTPDKKFWYELPDGSRSLNGTRRVLYGLPELLQAVRDGRRVFYVEGAKSADRLALEGEVAVTAGGSEQWRPEFAEHFRGADVIIIADRDKPGMKLARQVQADLKPAARSVRVVQSATTRDRDDVVDHLDAGFSLDQLVPPEDDIAGRYKRIDWAAAFMTEAQDVRWLKEDFLEGGTLNCLFSKPGIGKSLLALDVAVELVRAGRTVMYIDDENRAADIVDRLRSFRVSPGELGNLVVYSFQKLPPLDTERGGEHLDALAEQDKPDLVILDTISRMVQGAENDADTYLSLYRCSLTRMKSRGITVLRLDHSGKDSSRGQRGSSAKESDADVLWQLDRTGDNLFSLECQKSRSGHIAYGTIISLTREHDPLRHIWDVQIDMPLSRYQAVMRQMDILGIPPSLGRDAVRKVFKDNGVTGVRNDQLQAAITERRNRARRLSAPSVPASDQVRNEPGDGQECPF